MSYRPRRRPQTTGHGQQGESGRLAQPAEDVGADVHKTEPIVVVAAAGLRTVRAVARELGGLPHVAVVVLLAVEGLGLSLWQRRRGFGNAEGSAP